MTLDHEVPVVVATARVAPLDVPTAVHTVCDAQDTALRSPVIDSGTLLQTTPPFDDVKIVTVAGPGAPGARFPPTATHRSPEQVTALRCPARSDRGAVVHEAPFVVVVTITGLVPVAVAVEPTTVQAAVEQASEVVALARTAVGTVPAVLHDDAPFVDRRRERISPLGEDSTAQVVVDEHDGVPRFTVPIVSGSLQVLSVVDTYRRDNWLSGTWKVNVNWFGGVNAKHALVVHERLVAGATTAEVQVAPPSVVAACVAPSAP